jgi:hypothetical protein
MIWRSETGIHEVSTNLETHCIAIVTGLPGGDLEVINLFDYSDCFTLENPCSAGLIDVCFSRQGDKIFTLSDLTDHRLIIWNNSPQTAATVNQKLDQVYKKCSVNPCDSSQYCLYGDEGIALGSITEALGEHTATTSHLSLEFGDKIPSTVINFVVWLPHSRLLVGNSHGLIFDIQFEDKKVACLGRFSTSEKRGSHGQKTEPLTPLCAVLNSNSLVIGADNGSIYWYPTFDLMVAPPVASVVEMAVPSQKSVLGKEAISSLVVDGNYVELLAGSLNGKIFRTPIQVIEEAVVEEDLLPDEEAQHVSKTKVIDAHSLGSDIKNGVVLCSKALSIVVQKTSGRSKCSLSLLVTGNIPTLSVLC